MQKKQLLGDAAIYTLANLTVAGVPFLLLPILTRVLDPAAYGVLAMFSVVVSFISIFVGLNVHGAITIRYLDDSKFDIPTYVSSTLAILAATSVLMLFCIFATGDLISELTSIPENWLYIAILIAFLQFLVHILLALWQASKKPVKYGVMRLSHALIDATASIALVIALTLSWQGRVSGMLAAWVCAAIAAVYYLVREAWLAKSINTAYMKDAMSYGIPLIPHSIGGVLLGMADRFMVNSILDASSAGIYVVAAQLGLILGLVADSFNKAFAPWLMENLRGINDDSRCKIVRLTYLYFFVIIVFASLASIVAPHALPFVVGPQFQSSGQILVFIIFGNAFVGMYYMVTNYIFFSRRTGLLSVLTITVGVVTVVVTWFLIMFFGVKGAAIGFMLGQASLFLGAWILSNYCVPMPWLLAIRTRRIQ